MASRGAGGQGARPLAAALNPLTKGCVDANADYDASGEADVGLGTEYAARSQGLNFVPLTEERYLLVCLKSALDTPPVQHLLSLLQSPTWQAHLNQLPGYASDHSGEVASMKRLLPWWTR